MCVCWVVVIPAQESLDFHPPLQGRGTPLLPEWRWGRPKGGRARAGTPAQWHRAGFSQSAEVAPCCLTTERKDQLRTLCLGKRFCRNAAQSRPFQRKESYLLIYSFYKANICQYRNNGKEVPAGLNPTQI